MPSTLEYGREAAAFLSSVPNKRIANHRDAKARASRPHSKVLRTVKGGGCDQPIGYGLADFT